MLIHPWNAATDAEEWQQWLAGTDRFGMLVVNNLDPTEAPLALPLTSPWQEILLHLARPNPIWRHLEAAAEIRLAVMGDYAYILTQWWAKAGGPTRTASRPATTRPRSSCVDPLSWMTPQGKVAILTVQLGDRQPEGGQATVAVDQPPYGRMLSGICGIRLQVLRVEAKFKYDDHNPVEHRERIIDRLHERGHGLDAGAATQQQRRLAAIGEWQSRRKQS